MKNSKNFGRYQIVSLRPQSTASIKNHIGFDYSDKFFTRRGLTAPSTRVGRIALASRMLTTCTNTIRDARRTAKKYAAEIGNVAIFNTEKGLFV